MFLNASRDREDFRHNLSEAFGVALDSLLIAYCSKHFVKKLAHSARLLRQRSLSPYFRRFVLCEGRFPAAGHQRQIDVARLRSCCRLIWSAKRKELPSPAKLDACVPFLSPVSGCSWTLFW